MPLGRLSNALITLSKYESENIPLWLNVLNIFPTLSPSFDIKMFILFVSSDGARVALKIIKNIDRYREAAMSEVEVLGQLKSLDADRR